MIKKDVIASVIWENNGKKKQLAGFITLENKIELIGQDGACEGKKSRRCALASCCCRILS